MSEMLEMIRYFRKLYSKNKTVKVHLVELEYPLLKQISYMSGKTEQQVAHDILAIGLHKEAARITDRKLGCTERMDIIASKRALYDALINIPYIKLSEDNSNIKKILINWLNETTSEKTEYRTYELQKQIEDERAFFV